MLNRVPGRWAFVPQYSRRRLSAPANAQPFQALLQFVQVVDLGGINRAFKSLAVNDSVPENDFQAIATPRRIVDSLVVRLGLMGSIFASMRQNILRDLDQCLVNFAAFLRAGLEVSWSAVMCPREIKLKSNLPFLVFDKYAFGPNFPAHMKALDKFSCTR